MTQALFMSMMGLGCLILVGLWGFFYYMFKRRGHLPVRLDTVEECLPAIKHIASLPTLRTGLNVGAAFDSFHLSDLSGQVVTLNDFRGKRLLLVNWNPGCRLCARIAAALAALQDGLERANVKLVLAACGDFDSNSRVAEAHGLKCTILLQTGCSDELHSVGAFVGLGTPSAYLLDEVGRVSTQLAVGTPQVLRLAHQTLSDAGLTVGPASVR